MSNKYTIVINNKSGADQNYRIFSQKPVLSPNVDAENLFTNIFQQADFVADSGATVFDIWKTTYAIVGTIKGGKSEGAQVTTTMTKDVTLGVDPGTGVVEHGTTLGMIVKGGVTPQFSQSPLQASSWENSFEVDTNDEFTIQEAKDQRFFVGLAASPDGTTSAPLASFIPQPSVEYQIQPVNTFYVTFASQFNVGQIIDVAKLGKSMLEVDFTTLPNTVIINHMANGKLVISKA